MDKFINSVTNPMQGAIQGFQNPQQPSGDSMQRFLDTLPILKNVRGGMEGAFGQSAVNNPQVSVANDTAMPNMLKEMPIVQGTKGFPKVGQQFPKYKDASQLISHEGAPDVARVNYYKQQINAGKFISPLKVIQEGTKWGIEDGKHRFQALTDLGYRFIPTIE